MSSLGHSRKEKWRPVVQNTRYEVSSFGRIRRVAPGQGAVVGRIMHQGENEWGYKEVQLAPGRKHYRVSVLVARAFIGPRPKGKEVNHKDNNKQNNSDLNLEYLTSSQNKIHSVDLFGSRKSPATKSLTKRLVRKLRREHVPYYVSIPSLAIKYGLTIVAIRYALGKKGNRIR